MKNTLETEKIKCELRNVAYEVGNLLTRSTRFTSLCNSPIAKFNQKFVKIAGVFKIRNAKTFAFFSNFVTIFADFHEICSDFLRFCRKCS